MRSARVSAGDDRLALLYSYAWVSGRLEGSSGGAYEDVAYRVIASDPLQNHPGDPLSTWPDSRRSSGMLGLNVSASLPRRRGSGASVLVWEHLGGAVRLGRTRSGGELLGNAGFRRRRSSRPSRRTGTRRRRRMKMGLFRERGDRPGRLGGRVRRGHRRDDRGDGRQGLRRRRRGPERSRPIATCGLGSLDRFPRRRCRVRCEFTVR